MFNFRKVKQLLDSNVGKTVIMFSTHGCMATIHEFEFIGTIIGIDKMLGDIKVYKVEVLKDRTGAEKRNKNLEQKYRNVYSNGLQSLGGNFLIHYDS